MYLEYYGLSVFPFQLTPDHRFFFESSVHRKAMSHLIFGLNQGEGFIVITGDVGAGKTTLLCRLLDTLDSDTYVVAKLVSTHLAGDDMLRSVASAFNLQFQGLDKASLLRRIEDFLIANHQIGRRMLLMVDEAQNVTPQALEELRMLSNFQIDNKVALQSVLLAQPQFRRILISPDLEQFRQRIIASFHLGEMRSDETREYILYRLTVAGWKNDPQIDEDVYVLIFNITGGIPRKINSFCSRLMLYCYLEDLHRIDSGAVAAVADDLAAERGAVLDASDGSGSTGIMHPMASGFGFPPDSREDLDRRVGVLERMVRKHTEALRQMVALGESLHGNGKPFD
jgi:putative secretion ATPase (PEP-CTERM system associated)